VFSAGDIARHAIAAASLKIATLALFERFCVK
jgi:hypothetical protein